MSLPGAQVRRVSILAACTIFLGAAVAARGSRQARPEVPITFDKYHGYEEVKDFLHRLAAAYPDLTRVYPMARDYKGYEMLVLEITNHRTGNAEEKPAFYGDGNIDNDEAAATELLLGLAHRLLTQYGSNEEVTKLMDTTTLYLVPMVNPYMSDLFVSTPMTDVVSSINSRPCDDDGDDLLDEDPPEDIDGDGLILQMRLRSIRGAFKTDPRNRRLIIPRKADEPGEWAVYSEGIDNDGDGLINEDPIGGIDLNRNFPTNWRPEWIQEGAGPYPLSEPESRGLADFIRAHPNIGFVVNGHGGPDDGIIYRPYSSLPDSEIPRQDYLTFQTFAEKFAELSGGLKLVSNYGPEAEKRFGPGRLVYGYGTLKEWAYDMAGAFGFTIETGMLPGDYNKDGNVTDEEMLRVSDEEFGGKLFVDWKPFQHPRLGAVEIGGFTKWSRPNPPAGKYLQRLVETYGAMNLYWASTLPHLSIREFTARPIAGGFKVSAVVENLGLLPTNLTEKSIENRCAKPVLVTLSASPDIQVAAGEMRQRIGHLQGVGFRFRRAVSSGGGSREEAGFRELTWIVHVGDQANAWLEVQASTPKAGIARKRLTFDSSRPE